MSLNISKYLNITIHLVMPLILILNFYISSKFKFNEIMLLDTLNLNLIFSIHSNLKYFITYKFLLNNLSQLIFHESFIFNF